jgi:hypothetical protein
MKERRGNHNSRCCQELLPRSWQGLYQCGCDQCPALCPSIPTGAPRINRNRVPHVQGHGRRGGSGGAAAQGHHRHDAGGGERVQGGLPLRCCCRCIPCPVLAAPAADALPSGVPHTTPPYPMRRPTCNGAAWRIRPPSWTLAAAPASPRAGLPWSSPAQPSRGWTPHPTSLRWQSGSSGEGATAAACAAPWMATAPSLLVHAPGGHCSGAPHSDCRWQSSPKAAANAAFPPTTSHAVAPLHATRAGKTRCPAGGASRLSTAWRRPRATLTRAGTWWPSSSSPTSAPRRR